MTSMTPLPDRAGLNLIKGRIGVIGQNEEDRWLHASIGAVDGHAIFRCGNMLDNCAKVRGIARVEGQATASGLITVTGDLESQGSTPVLVWVEGDAILHAGAKADQLRFVVGNLTLGNDVETPNLIGVSGDLRTDGKKIFPRLAIIGGRLLGTGVKRVGRTNKIEVNKELLPVLEILNVGPDLAAALIRQRTITEGAIDTAGGLSNDAAIDGIASSGLGL